MLADAAALAAVATAAVALILLWQGQRDRRSLRVQEHRGQAVLVTVSIDSSWTETGEDAKELDWCRLSILNESDQAIHLDSVTLVEASSWPVLQERGASGLTTVDVQVTDHLVRPRDEVTMQPPDGWYVEAGVNGSSFALVEFTDARGHRWRRRSDTFELEPALQRINTAQDFFQLITRHSTLARWLLATIPQRLAIRAARRRPKRVSRTLRWCRATHGYWPWGEEDPWLRPDEAPALVGILWPAATGYEGLETVAPVRNYHPVAPPSSDA